MLVLCFRNLFCFHFLTRFVVLIRTFTIEELCISFERNIFVSLEQCVIGGPISDRTLTAERIGRLSHDWKEWFQEDAMLSLYLVRRAFHDPFVDLAAVKAVLDCLSEDRLASLYDGIRDYFSEWQNRVLILLFKLTVIVDMIHERGLVHLDLKPSNSTSSGCPPVHRRHCVEIGAAADGCGCVQFSATTTII